LGLPLGEVRWAARDFQDPAARYVFASHPHGVGSLHHVGLMMCPATCPPGRAFADLSPIATRRDLGASVRPPRRWLESQTLCLYVCVSGNIR
jgi:hypothetical protein